MNRGLFSILFLLSGFAFAQQHKTFCEVAMFSVQQETNAYTDQDSLKSQIKSSRMTGGFILGYSLGFEMFPKCFLEFRPGLFIGDTDLLGADLGIQVRTFLSQKLFVIAGVQYHQNLGSSPDGHNADRTSESKTFIYPGILIGLDISKSISLFCGYYYSQGKSWRASWRTRSYRNYEKLDDLFKIGIEYNF